LPIKNYNKKERKRKKLKKFLEKAIKIEKLK